MATFMVQLTRFFEMLQMIGRVILSRVHVTGISQRILGITVDIFMLIYDGRYIVVS